MAATGELRTHFSLTAAIFSDPWRKLAAIVLALLLWHHLDSRVTSTQRVDLTLIESDTSQPISAQLQDELQVRIDKRIYSLEKCSNGVTGEEIPGIELVLEGPKHLIASLEENPGFTVIPRLGGTPLLRAAEIEVDDIRAINSAYQQLITAMVPSSVFVHLARNDEQLATVSQFNILVTPPEGVPEFEDRLTWDAGIFSARTVTLFGPQEAVAAIMRQAKLFDFKPSAPAAGNPRVRGELSLIDPSGKVKMDPARVSLEIPLQRLEEEILLEDVPVLLCGPPSVRERFKPKGPEGRNVTIRATNNLEGKLSSMDPDELREWAKTQCRLLALLPEEIELEAVVPRPVFVILDTTYVDGRDYKVTVRPPVSIVRKTDR